MKKLCLMIIVIVVFGILPSISSAQTVPLAPGTYDKNMAGITAKGIAYLSDQWVKTSGYGQPNFVSSMTGWSNKIPMKLNQFGYWEANIGRTVSGSVIFCFEMDFSDKWIPHLLVDQGILKVSDKKNSPNAVVDNGGGGFNFNATPVAKAPWEK